MGERSEDRIRSAYPRLRIGRGLEWRSHCGRRTLKSGAQYERGICIIESFGRAIRHAIELRPYVHHDDTRGCVVRVTDAVVCEEGFEVLELRVPMGQTVKEWYGCGLVQRRNRAVHRLSRER
jgi:hypothetical protein